MLTAEVGGISEAQLSGASGRTQPNYLQMDVSWWLLIFLAYVSRGSCDFEVTQESRDVVVILNTSQAITQISDKFLGISTSPVQLLNDPEYSVATVNMLQALAPGYLRVGGPESDDLVFTNKSSGFLMTESRWIKINQLAEDIGSHLIFSLSPRSHSQTTQLLKYSDEKGYDITWQLGYRTADNNRTTKAQLIEFGKEVSNLRRLIESFPRYQNKATLSSDIEVCEDPRCFEAYKTFFSRAKDAVDVVVLQITPQENFKGIKNMFDKLNKIYEEIADSAFNKDTVVRKAKNAMRTNIWIAETGSAGGIAEAVGCSLALGLAGRLGYHTYLLHLPHLTRPAPGYWAALLWRALVGRAVLGLRLWPQEPDVTVFAACTQTRPHPLLEMEWEYDTGAVTLWGVNSAEKSAQLSLQAGLRLGHIHLYTLTGENLDTGNILLNGRLLHLVHGVLPRLAPRVRMLGRDATVTVPSQSVFYIILPDAQAPACLINIDGPLKRDDSPVVPNIRTSRGPSLSGKIGIKPVNIYFEKGGIFADTSVKKKKLDNSVQTETKKDTLEVTATVTDDREKITEKNLGQNEKMFDETKDSRLLNISSISDIERNVTALTNNNTTNSVKLRKESSAENFEKYKQEKLTVLKNDENKISSESSIKRNKSYKSYVNSTKTIDNIIQMSQAVEAAVHRVKRSENYGYYDQISETGTETSPLYRKVNLLKQILSKMQQQIQYEDEEKNRYLIETDTLKSLQSNNKIKPTNIGKVYSTYPVKVSSRRTDHINEARVPAVQSKNVEDINYLPGEFYEILGGMKLDSNTSLKDKEEIIESTDSLHNKSKPQNCNYLESKLTVTKRPENDPQEDRRLVEQATENSMQYYLSKNDTADYKENNEKVKVLNKWNKFPTIISSEGIKSNNEKEKLRSVNFFQNLKKEENKENPNQIEFKRTKRDVYSQEDIDDDLDQYLKLSQFNEEKFNKSDFSDEVELRRFLEELTNEGEQLLQTIDEEYKNNIENGTGAKQILTTETIPALIQGTVLIGSKNFSAEDKAEEYDFYLKNNILIDKGVKPKLNYRVQDEAFFTSLPESNNTIKSNENLTKNQPSSTIESNFGSNTSQTNVHLSVEPSLTTEETTSGDLNNTNNIAVTNFSEVINNYDAFIEKVKPEGNTTFPGINLLSQNESESFNHSLLAEIPDTTYNLSQVSEKGKETAEPIQKIEESYSDKKEKHKDEPITRNISDPITVTEQIFVGETIGVNNSHDYNTSGYPSKSLSTNHIEGLEKIDNYKVSGLDKQGEIIAVSKFFINPKNNYNATELGKKGDIVVISKTLITPTISDNLRTTTENIFEKKRRIVSESKLENKILPPPSKPKATLNPLLIPPILTFNHTSSLPNAIDIINKRIAEFNNKHKLSVPVLARSSLVNTTLSDKYKENLETIKQRLQRARERFLNITGPRATVRPVLSIPKPQRTKREITVNKNIFNSFSNEQKNKQGSQSKKNRFYSMSEEAKESVLKYSLPETFPFHRPKRQTDEDIESESTSSGESISSQHVNEDKDYDNKNQPSPHILKPYYFSAIKKWVIPLSNNTENVLYKNRLFPVNLYGIVSDKWVQEHMNELSNNEGRRRRRAIQYPCIKDKFNNFEEEASSKTPWSFYFGNGKVSSVSSTKAMTDTGIENTKSVLVHSQTFTPRSRRAANQDIEKNEIEMKALLTNEIVKEGPVNDVPNRDNVFSSLLHQTLTKTTTNKTGLERMLELAKQYHETNPTSLEIFSTQTKQTKNKKFSVKGHEKTDEENAALEIKDGFNANLTANQLDFTKDTTSYIFKEYKGANNSSVVENPSSGSKNASSSLKGDLKTPEDAWSDFINKIKEFFEDLATEIKKRIL